MRIGLPSIVLLAVLAGACASEDPESSPTAPTPPPAAPPVTAPPPSNSCRPGAASNLSWSLSGSTRTITWTAGANATGYDVQIGTSSGGSEILYERTTQTFYSWTGGGSSTSNTFYVRVHSHNSCGSGPPSAELVIN